MRNGVKVLEFLNGRNAYSTPVAVVKYVTLVNPGKYLFTYKTAAETSEFETVDCIYKIALTVVAHYLIK